MSDREDVEVLADLIAEARDGYPRLPDDMDSGELADLILGSDWLAARDARTLADEHARLADRLDRHVWHGGYFCQCGHELNSAGGWFRHLAGEDT